MAFEITVGYAAGFIALALFIVQIWCPTILTFILAACLRDKETAATWSVAARSMLSSHWPFMLRSESSSRYNVRTSVYLASISYPTITIITAAAGVVTPLGLYDAVMTSQKLETPKFAYAPDHTSFGLATGPRLNHTFTRICGTILPMTCPGETDVSVIEASGLISGNGSYPFGLKSRVSDDVIDIFSSGTKGAHTTVSNSFDIEWRQLTWYRDPRGTDGIVYDNGTVRSVGRFQQIDSSILRNEYKVVEGLVVDAKDGGLGFRNHTIPSDLPLGGEWSEDLLFIEPQSACVNTNLTLEFTITTEAPSSKNKTVGSMAGIKDLVLVDRGGFCELNHTYPQFDLNRDNAQTDPQLRTRAYKAAWLSNAYIALIYNITNSAANPNYTGSWAYMTSSMNKRFPLSTSEDFDKLNRLSISRTMGAWLSQTDIGNPELFPNPEKISSTNFSSINVVCEGAGGGDIANYSNIYTGCFQMRGVPSRIDGGYEGTLEAGSRWSSPIHTCATSIKASIKTIRFKSTGPNLDLSSLKVLEITPKQYSSPDKYPIWGIESTDHWLRDVIPIWGIISKSYENHPLIKSLKQPSIYLPGFYSLLNGLKSDSMGVNLPSAQFPSAVLQAVGTGQTVLINTVSDYSGGASLSMLQRWRELSKSPETAGQIINLIWTDIATSAVAGSKGVLGHRNEEKEQIKIKVYPVTRKVKYNMAFAVPGLVLAVIALLVTVIAGVLACFKGGRVRDVHKALRQSSTGRLITVLIGGQGESDLRMGSKEWSLRNGGREVDLSGLVPLMVEKVQEQRQVDDGTGFVYNGYGGGQGYQGYSAVSSVATTTASTTPDPQWTGQGQGQVQGQAQGLQWVVYQGEPYLYYPQQQQQGR
ncbi:hypothetical protein QBC38DRAFT_511321 [Podospora fimiseda]|uniref:Uncharacterized protein n=1 Tax=Podospora fimiseda TaxID=252190 RepID=A0AAN7GR79_9PEZI|nr:hypothetical protein QBC38DRAFT_511321 [Podospora fimiseda]